MSVDLIGEKNQVILQYGIMGTIGQATGKSFQAAVFGEFMISILTAMTSIPASSIDDWRRYVNINFLALIYIYFILLQLLH